MKRSIIFFILSALLFVSLNTSMKMYSVESGNIYTENFNLNHLLISPSSVAGKLSQQFDEALPTSGQCTHFHVIPLNPLILDNNGEVSHFVKILPITFPFLSQSNLLVSQIVSSPEILTKFKILPLGYSSLRNAVVLRS